MVKKIIEPEKEDIMIRTDFFNSSDGGYALFPQQQQFSNTWKKVLAFEKTSGKSLDNGFTKEEYIALFNSILTRSTSTFFNDKKVVMYYVRYLIAHGSLPAQQEEILASVSVDDLRIKEENKNKIRYFKNLNHLHECIEDTVKAAGRIDDGCWNVPMSILYLAWFGLTTEQILTLPKKNVLENGIILDNVTIMMPSFVTNVLCELRDSDGFKTRGRGEIKRKYMYSDYLIRTEDSYQLSLPQMRASLSRMDRVMGHVYSLKYNVAYQSGIFYRAYMEECESTEFNLNDVEFASRVFHEDLTAKNQIDPDKPRRERVRDYVLYKQLLS